MSEPVVGKIAKVLDKYRIIATIGSDHGVDKSMKFRVYESVRIKHPDSGAILDEYQHEKAVVVPKEVSESTTLMQTETEISETSLSERISQIAALPTKSYPVVNRNKLNTANDVPDDIGVVREGDYVEQMVDKESETAVDNNQKKGSQATQN